MGSVKILIKDMVGYVPAQLVPALLSFAAIPVITRILSPQQYGEYTLILTTVSILTTLVGWLGMSVIRFYPEWERPDKRPIFISTVISWLLVTVGTISGIVFLVLLTGSKFVGRRFVELMFMGLALFGGLSFFETLMYFLRAMRRSTWYSALAIWKNAASLLIGVVIVVTFNAGCDGLLIGAILATVAAVPVLSRLIGVSSPRICLCSKALLGAMARYGVPLMFGNVAAWVLNLSDRYILQAFCGQSAVGIYSASYSIAEKSILLVVSVFAMAVRPVSVRVWEREGKERARRFLAEATRLYLILTIPMAIGLSTLARPVFAILVGHEFRFGYIITPFIAASVVFLGLQQRFQEGLVWCHKTSLIMLAIGGGGLANVALNIAFVPRYGYVAAGVNTLVGYFLVFCTMVLVSRRYIVWTFPLRSALNATSAGSIMGLLLAAMVNAGWADGIGNLLAMVFLGALIYAVSLAVFGEIRPAEWQVLWRIMLSALKSVGLCRRKASSRV